MTASAPQAAESPLPPAFPCGDALDKQIARLSGPAVLNFLVNPLVGAVDAFWVGRLKDPLALAGQAAANQCFSTSFWIANFVPVSLQNPYPCACACGCCERGP